jgi:hypothetical protein
VHFTNASYILVSEALCSLFYSIFIFQKIFFLFFILSNARDLLEVRNLDRKGVKADLVSRLQSYLATLEFDAETHPASASPSKEDPNSASEVPKISRIIAFQPLFFDIAHPGNRKIAAAKDKSAVDTASAGSGNGPPELKRGTGCIAVIIPTFIKPSAWKNRVLGCK